MIGSESRQKIRGQRIIVIEGTSGNPQEDRDFKQALKILTIEAGYSNMKEMILRALQEKYPELEPYVEQQLENRRKYWPRKVQDG